jgi:3-oxoacyl-[acyl-carrier protein] reductase
MNTLQDKVAIVTGSSMGIGQAIAELFAEEGAKTVINSRVLARAQKVSDALQARGFAALPMEADVSRKVDVDRLVQETVKTWGRLDILVNNAGVSMISPSEELSEEHWCQAIDINLTGPFLCSQAAAKVMIPQGGGVIINISSILGEVGLPMRAAYCASKHGLNGLTKVLGTEWSTYNIRVNAINPAYIRTPMDVQDQVSGGYSDADIERRTPIGRFGETIEVAKAVLFLASDASSYVTGTTLNVDGGWMAYGGW